MRLNPSMIMWFLLVLSLPLEVVSYYSGFTFKLWMLILFVVFLLWAVKFMMGKEKVTAIPLAALLLFLIAANLMSGFNAENSRRLYRMIIQYGMLSILAFFVANSIRSEKQAASIAGYMVFSGVVLSLYGIFQFAGGGLRVRYQASRRVLYKVQSR